jgi:hypothetical protein
MQHGWGKYMSGLWPVKRLAYLKSGKLENSLNAVYQSETVLADQ